MPNLSFPCCGLQYTCRTLPGLWVRQLLCNEWGCELNCGLALVSDEVSWTVKKPESMTSASGLFLEVQHCQATYVNLARLLLRKQLRIRTGSRAKQRCLLGLVALLPLLPISELQHTHCRTTCGTARQSCQEKSFVHRRPYTLLCHVISQRLVLLAGMQLPRP
ncbi:hypothetical protein N658DRAFT_196174 [Parathielavia hyrcaniae]|uniref:Uncharacterized protein n=1 Tax=Parathielavia hyrcaniae TaxID=113614 RepID=A0AAN6T4L0_9PEZI|nr:hypothetical protein N658DRAFT_196174 [Parathielavia hyrcaniae]